MPTPFSLLIRCYDSWQVFYIVYINFYYQEQIYKSIALTVQGIRRPYESEVGYVMSYAINQMIPRHQRSGLKGPATGNLPKCQWFQQYFRGPENIGGICDFEGLRDFRALWNSSEYPKWWTAINHQTRMIVKDQSPLSTLEFPVLFYQISLDCYYCSKFFGP